LIGLPQQNKIALHYFFCAASKTAGAVVNIANHWLVVMISKVSLSLTAMLPVGLNANSNSLNLEGQNKLSHFGNFS
jgi:hypothetical protein